MTPKSDLEGKLQTEANAYQTLQTEYTKIVRTRTQLESQLKENEEVAKEFSLLKTNATIYKLIGPVLVKQDTPEAVSNVSKRIEYIRTEIKRVETRIHELQDKQEKKKMEIVKLQQLVQASQQQQSGGGGVGVGAGMGKPVAV